MRGILVLAMLTWSLAYGAAHDYVKVKDLRLPAEGISELQIHSGAGGLEVNGVASASDIAVTATISVPTRKDSTARRIIKSDMILTLEQEGERAKLTSYFEPGLWGWDGTPNIGLSVVVPDHMILMIDDGAGLVKIQDVHGDITIDDGSGAISMIRVGGDIRIDDGSGSISVKEVGESVSIVDGSGSITVRSVGGGVTINDGSGGIDISDVKKDLIIEEDASGSLRVARIDGRIENPE